ncbi:PIH1 domain-containing protein 1-like [Lingula anatina]|uniref:PIH1 domain-containing protein 1 n=1 Tax=Lingula anatina TaxID=7574 RepID=A0A1S3HP69_LINAN|nr:PIH1 domain-containing protein 1-like [Lingula anatina]|eukprot:XP_013387848.1 PIH1 domain-containing protein 1-like [Lingula anatina]
MAGMTSTDLLEAELEENAIYKKLLMEAAAQNSGLQQQTPHFKTVIPKPGFCLKTKTDKEEKVFINVCSSETLPKPKDITEEDLIKVLESEDPTAFRVPMSLGEPHAEIDKSGKGCTAYDVIIHPDFLEKCKQSELFVKFLITISIEGLEEKYSMLLDRNYTMLKNRKFLGTLPEQNIRTQSKPLIMEMGSAGASAPGKPLISEVSSFNSQATKPKGEEPKYTIVQEPPDGHPEFLVAEIQLPKVKTAKSLTLDLGEDRIFLQTRSDIYLLDIYLPFNLIQDECGAQFNRQTKVLTLTMPVVLPCS